MTSIVNQQFQAERSLYNLKDAEVINCRFAGPEDGESPLKEARNTLVSGCTFALRYPFWHDRDIRIVDCLLEEPTRAPLWYCSGLDICNTEIYSVKSLRECSGITIKDSKFYSEEFMWRCKDVVIDNVEVQSAYAFFQCENMEIRGLNLKGKYSFQYTRNITIRDSVLDTKDAFWHAENITVIDSVVKGEYLSWYSDRVTFINCKIIGTQPLCYDSNLVLKNCTMEGCDFSFEYSHVDADVVGHILSVKNPGSGTILCDSCGEVIMEDAVYPANGSVILRGNQQQ